jgi:parallel beta-helix repeat protein
MRNIMTITLLGLLLFALAPLAYADYHYASHSGSNTYPYTSWETAADTIQSAVDAASPGDTIYIGSGEYIGRTVMNSGDSLMALIGMGMDSTYLYSAVEEDLLETGPKCYIRSIHFANLRELDNIVVMHIGWDLTVENCLFTRGPGFLFAPANIVVRNCIFDDLRTIYPAIADAAGTQSLEVSNCLFRNLRCSPVRVFGLSVIIKNNIVLNSLGAMAFYLHYTENGYNHVANNIIQNPCCGGYYVAFTDTATRVTNNVVNNSYNSDFSGAGIAMSSFDARIENNTLTNSTGGIWLTGNSRLSVHYSDFWNNMGFDLYAGDNGSFDTSLGYIHVNPMFNNPDSGDFRLQEFSPLIDAGDPMILDYDGSRSDIGAFGGPGGRFYEYQDLSPQTPDSLRSLESGDTLTISWTWNTEADFYRYIVWKDTVSGFTPWAGNIIAEPDTDFIYDFNWDRFHNYYYRVAAYDNQGNLSLASSELAVINVGIWGEPSNLPYTTYIETNYPNPFNNATTIVYFVADVGPQPAEIEITVYDIGGRLIRKLYSGREEAGEHRISWDGRDDNNRELSSGVYFARISQWGIDFINHPRKLVLVK